eukprot:4348613-Amphidinium_carterae.1
METIREEVTPQVSPAHVKQPQLCQAGGIGGEDATQASAEVQPLLHSPQQSELQEGEPGEEKGQELGLEPLPDLVAGLSSASPVEIVATSGSVGLEAST